MTGLGILGDPRCFTFTGRVVRYESDSDVVISGVMGSVKVNIGEAYRERFKVDTEVIISVSATTRRVVE
jgi:hypothetical protein